MVAATIVTVVSVIASPGVVVCSAAAEGAVVGLFTSTFGAGTPASVAGAIGTAASTGAITGALVGGKTAGSAAIGAAVAGTAATGISATSAGMSGAVTAGAVSGPVLWLVLGTEFSNKTVEQRLSFDCWKPLLHDTSTNPSNGMLLRDVLMDPRIKNIEVSDGIISGFYPLIKLENVWGEHFKIEYVLLPWNEIAAHAVPL